MMPGQASEQVVLGFVFSPFQTFGFGRIYILMRTDRTLPIIDVIPTTYTITYMTIDFIALTTITSIVVNVKMLQKLFPHSIIWEGISSNDRCFDYA